MDKKIDFQTITYSHLYKGLPIHFDDKFELLKLIQDRREILLEKPTGFNPDEVCAILALDNNVPIGIIILFSNRLLLNGESVIVQSGTILYSHPDYKSYGIGGDLFYAFSFNQKAGAFVGGISQQAMPMYHALKYSVFELPRYICLIHSKSVVAQKLKVKGFAQKAFSSILDTSLRLVRKTNIICRTKLRKYKIIKRNSVTPEIINIINADEHKFKEIHDKSWWDWNLNNSFNRDPRNHKDLYEIVLNESVVGFFLLKYEYFEQASARGFKDVMLATVMEWGIAPNSALKEKDINLFAINEASNKCDAIQIATNDIQSKRSIKLCGSMQIGCANVAALIRGPYKSESKDPNNWRLRLAASDTLID